MNKLKVIAVRGHLVTDDVAMTAGERWRFIGRSPFMVKQGVGPEEAYPPVESEYPDNAEHRYILQQIRKGALEARDEHTARRAGVAIPRVSPQKEA